MSEVYYTKPEVDALIEKAVNDAAERSLRVLPFVIKNLIASAGKMKEVREAFYDRNKDLVNHKELVAKVMEEIETRHPAVGIEKIAELTAKETKRRLASVGSMSTEWVDKPTRSELQLGLDGILEKL